MKFSGTCCLVVCAAASVAVVVTSFSPPRSLSSVVRCNEIAPTTTTPVLFVSTLGFTEADILAAPETSTKKSVINANPDANIQSYLKEPTPVELRQKMTGTCLVSGFVNENKSSVSSTTTATNDQFVFDLLNDPVGEEEKAEDPSSSSSFGFQKIVAFVDDVKLAKKRLLSRSARYTGLLDKLDFSEASTVGSLPTEEQLEGVGTWVAAVDSFEKAKEVAGLASKCSSLENLSVLVTNGGSINEEQQREEIVRAMKDTQKTYTLLVVAGDGGLRDGSEGDHPYRIEDFVKTVSSSTEEKKDSDSNEDDNEIFSLSNGEAMRMIAETLRLESGSNIAVALSEIRNVNATESKLVKGLREAGYDRTQEIDHMLRNGTENYQKALDEFNEKNPGWKDGVVTTDAWWETPEFLAELEEDEIRRGKGKKSSDEEKQKAALKKKEEMTKEEEEAYEISMEWAKREFFNRRMDNTLDESVTQESFIESIWDTAILEGNKKYNQLKGVGEDEAAADAYGMMDFQTQQKRRLAITNKSAKADLQRMFDEEGLGDVDEMISDQEEDEDDEEDDWE